MAQRWAALGNPQGCLQPPQFEPRKRMFEDGAVPAFGATGPARDCGAPCLGRRVHPGQGFPSEFPEHRCLLATPQALVPMSPAS